MRLVAIATEGEALEAGEAAVGWIERVGVPTVLLVAVLVGLGAFVYFCVWPVLKREIESRTELNEELRAVLPRLVDLCEAAERNSAQRHHEAMQANAAGFAELRGRLDRGAAV